MKCFNTAIKDPYDAIAEYLYDYYDIRFGYASFIAHLRLVDSSGDTYDLNSYVSIEKFDGKLFGEWDVDWWEGEPYIMLIGAIQIDDIQIDSMYQRP